MSTGCAKGARRTGLRAWLCAAGLAFGAAAAQAAGGGGAVENFRLTPQLLERMAAIQAASDAALPDAQALEAQSVEDLARQLDADPRSRKLLRQHQVSAREIALAAFAVLHAGMFLAMEGAADQKARSAALSSFTPEQRANIELLRRRGP